MRRILPRLAIFDLDHTLLQGDTDTLWCEYLLDRKLLPASFAKTNLQLQAQYRCGQVSPQDFSRFYAQTLAAFPVQTLHQLRADFTAQVIRPCVKPRVANLLAHHRAQGDVLVLSSATSYYLIALTGQLLGFEHVLGTELGVAADGLFTGQTQGVLNMREGKVTRLTAWLHDQGWAQDSAILQHAYFYSDSINDLPLLQAVGHPVAVDPDPLLRQTALDLQWPILSLS